MVSMRSALRIKYGKTKIIVDKKNEDGKYSVWLVEPGSMEPILSTAPVFKTKKEAREALATIIRDIKKNKDI